MNKAKVLPKHPLDVAFLLIGMWMLAIFTLGLSNIMMAHDWSFNSQEIVAYDKQSSDNYSEIKSSLPEVEDPFIGINTSIGLIIITESNNPFLLMKGTNKARSINLENSGFPLSGSLGKELSYAAQVLSIFTNQGGESKATSSAIATNTTTEHYSHQVMSDEPRGVVEMDDFNKQIGIIKNNLITKVASKSAGSAIESTTNESSSDDYLSSYPDIHRLPGAVNFNGTKVPVVGYKKDTSGFKFLGKEAELKDGKKLYDSIIKRDEWSITYKAKGEEKKSVIVFTDPSCPYCRKLHGDMEELNEMGVTVKYLFYPRHLALGKTNKTALGTLKTMNSIWCSEDQHESMDRAYDRRPIAEAVCLPQTGETTHPRANFPAFEHYLIGEMLSIKGTPATLLEDGTIVSGYATTKQYLRNIDL
jgi:thiol-disulfide isomerase/thioredoxin